MFFLIVVAELADDVVALFQRSADLVQAVAGDEGACGEAAFGVIAHDQAVTKPSGNHLSPGGIRVIGLVGYRGIAAEIEGVNLRGGFYHDAADGRGGSRDKQVERVVPRVVALFALFHFDAVLMLSVLVAIYIIRCTLVDQETDGLRLPFLGGLVFHHQTAVLSENGGLGGFFLGAERHRDAVVSIGDLYLEHLFLGDVHVECLCGGCGSYPQQG